LRDLLAFHRGDAARGRLQRRAARRRNSFDRLSHTGGSGGLVTANGPSTPLDPRRALRLAALPRRTPAKKVRKSTRSARRRTRRRWPSSVVERARRNNRPRVLGGLEELRARAHLEGPASLEGPPSLDESSRSDEPASTRAPQAPSPTAVVRRRGAAASARDAFMLGGACRQCTARFFGPISECRCAAAPTWATPDETVWCQTRTPAGTSPRSRARNVARSANAPAAATATHR
jgi:hypothetical protein